MISQALLGNSDSFELWVKDAEASGAAPRSCYDTEICPI